ncbi:hypothetical protein [Vreelandella arcis]|uniref:Uncharacterized protein n=1 Tax=Vreelandella arcis TaxID=416873 RepID=A0A1H0JE18_9GAMM|nr:hypothetical protein [Halomonas arcis]SDO41874.1 hypothetical protein SAMN04487951_12614 [Halomonas arcis]
MARIVDADFFRQAVREKEGARMLQRFTLAVAQSIQLKWKSPEVVLAPLLGQPPHLSNYVALEKWVARELAAGDLYATQSTLETLSKKLERKLSDTTAA